MNCHEISYILDANTPEELGPDQKRAVDQHLRNCRECREAWAAYRELSALPVPSAPGDLYARIAATLAATPGNARSVRRALPLGAILAVGAAIAATVAYRVVDNAPELVPRIEEPTPEPTTTSPASAIPAVPAGRVEDAGSVDRESMDSRVESSRSTSSHGEHALDPNSIVVIPVSDRGADPRHAEALEQCHDELLRQLQLVPGLNVVPPEVVAPFLGSGTPEEEIARGLGAAHLVLLSTRFGLKSSGSKLWLMVTFVDVATGAADGFSSFRALTARWPAELSSHVAHVVDSVEYRRKIVTPAERSAAISDARATVLNSSLSPGERYGALNNLPQTTEAWSEAVVAVAVELAAIAPKLRGEIWRLVNGVDNPYLIEPLLQSLAYDDEHTRREAAAALRSFVAEPGVQAALEQARASDVSEAVRDSAQNALLTDKERDELALQKLLDETLPARQRLSAINIRNGRNHRSVPLTDEAAIAVFDMGARSTDAGVRSSAWALLGRNRVHDPSFTSVLLDDLVNHPDASVRAFAARALSQHTDDSAVHAALERAKTDPAFAVRSAARSTLGKDSR